MKMKNRNILGGAAVIAVSLAFTAPVSAMPSDIREALEHDLKEDGDLIDDSALLEDIGTYYVATGAGNVRDYPNGNIIDVLTPGEKYYVNARRTDCDWYQIPGYVSNAYVYTSFLVPEEEYLGNRTGGASDESSQEDDYEFTKLDIMMQATVDVNMRRQPGGTIVDVLKAGTDIHVTGNLDNLCWYQCENKGETVYVYDDYLVPDFPQTMAATHIVNVRTEPSLNGTVLGTLSIGDKVKVSGIENGWYRFTFEKTKEVGYSYSDYLAAVE
ncbi:MAG: SH3 domain-containing protein [Eubacteriales bacterium]|nr:SH3 domain-containing protein [Eubacteriales bacterium]